MSKIEGQLAMERKIEAMIEDFKLIPSAKPPLFHTYTVRSNIKCFWNKKLRPHMLELLDRTCCTCGWQPATKIEERKLHLHEVEKYDYQNMVIHLIDLELICVKCHAFHHIMRTEMVTADEQWEDLKAHFAKVNNCDRSIFDDWDLILTKSLQRNEQLMGMPGITEQTELENKVRRFAVSDDVPFARVIRSKLGEKGLLYPDSDMKGS